MRNLQIGVIGSMADLKYSKQTLAVAEDLGRTIARRGFTLVFGAEKDSDSLPTAAARAAGKAGGLTVGVTYESGLSAYDDSAVVLIASGMVRGGGRELVQALSCDGLIAIDGGSGTLNEITVAYQAGIPVVCLSQGGWSQKLAGTYLDARRRYRFGKAKNAESALGQLVKMIQSKQGKSWH